MRVQESGTSPRSSRDYGKYDFGDIVASGFSIAEQLTVKPALCGIVTLQAITLNLSIIHLIPKIQLHS